MLLEFGRKKFGHFFIVDLFFSRLFLAIFVNNWFFGLRLGRSNNEDIFCRIVTEGISIKNVTSILAIVEAQAPPEGFAEKFITQLFAWVLFFVFTDLALNFE